MIERFHFSLYADEPKRIKLPVKKHRLKWKENPPPAETEAPKN